MKNNISSLLLTILFMITLHQVAFANGEIRELKAFNGIDVSGSVKLILKKGTDHSADVEVKEADISDLITEVKNGKLKIYFKKNLFKYKNKHATVTITYVELQSLDASSGSYLGAHDMIECEEMDIDCSSGSSINIELDATNVELDASSGSSVTIGGRAYTLDVEASSGSSVGAKQFECAYAEVDASSGSTVKVWVLEGIKAEASSGSSIAYKGSPKETDISKGYSGSVKQLK